MSRVFWKGQQAIALVAVTGGILFWFAHGFIKGIQFALAVWFIMQIPILLSYWKKRP